MSLENKMMTRIQHKRDIDSNWKTATDFYPKAGELIVYEYSNNPSRLKIGNGSTPVTELPFIDTNSVYQLDTTVLDKYEGATHIDKLSKYIEEQEVLLNTGDIAILKSLIAEDAAAYTAYVYTNGVWAAMSGNYNAENVYFPDDITITTSVGNIELDNGSAKIPAKGKNLTEVFEALWTKEEEPEVTNPSVEITTDLQYKEVGSTVAPSYTAILNPGSYTYGPETGITAQSWSVVFGEETKTTASGNFSTFTVTENECCEVTATATYNDGAIPVTNLNKPCSSKQIKGGSSNPATITKNLITGYRPNFYGFKGIAIDIESIDSAVVRAFGTNQAQTTTPKTSVTCDTSWMQFFYAVPKGRKTTLSVKDSNNLPLTVKSKEVTVNHVGSASSTYTVFYINNDAPYGATTLKLTWE